MTLPNICVSPDFPIVVSGYTISSHLGDYYKRASHRLSKSLLKHDLAHIIFPLKHASSWAKNCALKQTLILQVLETMNHPVLWIDIDGEVFKYPSVFENAKFDMAICSVSGHWLTGTLYFSAKKKSMDFVRLWRQKTKPSEPDEVSLLHLFRCNNSGLKLQMLDNTYNSVVHKETNLAKVTIGHYLRPDVAPHRGVKAIPIKKTTK